MAVLDHDKQEPMHDSDEGPHTGGKPYDGYMTTGQRVWRWLAGESFLAGLGWYSWISRHPEGAISHAADEDKIVAFAVFVLLSLGASAIFVHLHRRDRRYDRDHSSLNDE